MMYHINFFIISYIHQRLQKNRGNLMRHCCRMVYGIWFQIIVLWAQPASTVYHGALLEPVDGVIHGAGQSPDAFRNYFQVMDSSEKPVSSMYYLRLLGITPGWSREVKTDLFRYGDKLIIPHIGLSLTIDGRPEAHYEHLVAAGQMDKEILIMVEALKELAMPVFLRIGYECNGMGWNGYLPDSYRQAFRRIADRIRVEQLEVATVWNIAVEGEPNFMDYYPGDDVVDWWAINIFDADMWTHPLTIAFLDSAKAHGKPVMIAESTPRYVGANQGDVSWNQWFSPFFQVLNQSGQIKAFFYINWDWSTTPLWPDWGDARLETPQAATVLERYRQQLDAMFFVHATSESEFRRKLGYSDEQAPAVPESVRFEAAWEKGHIRLSWNPVDDPAGLAHYLVRVNGQRVDYSLEPACRLIQFTAGDTLAVAVSAMDRAGNESSRSGEIGVWVPDTVQKIRNGDFEEGFNEWLLFYGWNGGVLASVDSVVPIAGQRSVRLDILQTGSWEEIQLRQILYAKPYRRYRVSLKIRADQTTPFFVAFGKAYAAESEPILRQYSADLNTTEVQTEFLVQEEGEYWFGILIGQSEASRIWLDDIRMTEIELTPAGGVQDRQDMSVGRDFRLLGCYPNPFNGEMRLELSATKDIPHLVVEICNLLGQRVQKLYEGPVAAGMRWFGWQANGIGSGVYFLRVISENHAEARKIVVLR